MSTTEQSGLLLSMGVAGVALALLVWQWAERRRREPNLSDEDTAHFAQQDLRRWVVVGVLVLLAVGVFFGSRFDPRVNGRPNSLFIGTWFAVFLLLMVLGLLSMLDWIATRRYARRHRAAILSEGLKILQDGMKLRAASRPMNGPVSGDSNGRSGPRASDPID